jgi:predicted deacetylase
MCFFIQKPQSSVKKIRIELHDIAPSTLFTSVRLLQLLQNLATDACDLMIIPDHREYPYEPLENVNKENKGNPYSELTRFANDWAKQGHKLYCHGLHHHANPTQPRSALGKIANALTHNQAELAGLRAEHCFTLLQKARQRWTAHNLPPAAGFVAPTWHAPHYLEQQVLSLFPEYGSRLFWKTKHQSQFSIPLSFTASTLNALRTSLKMGQFLLTYTALPLRLVLHPQDADTPEKFALIEQFLKKNLHCKQM